MEPQKSIVLPVSIGVLVSGIVFGGLGYYIANSQNVLEPAVTPTQTVQTATPTTASTVTPTAATTDELASWKTYENKSHGYTIKYPNDWVEAGAEYKGESDLVLHSPNTLTSLKNPNALEVVSDLRIGYYDSAQKLEVNGGKVSGAKSLLDYLKAEKIKQEIVLDYNSFKIGEYDGYIVDQPNIGGIDNYYLEKNGHIYTFVLDSDTPVQILSTFKITN